MKFKTCNPDGLRISHTKFELNRRQKIFPDSKGGLFDDFLKIRKIPKGPPFGKKIKNILKNGSFFKETYFFILNLNSTGS